MKYVILTVLLLIPFSAFAEKQTEAVCDTLSKYKKINNQSATYQPGVDVNGNAVASADLNSPSTIFQNVTKVPLTVDLAQRLASLQGKGIEVKANFGQNFNMLSIHPDGRVTFGDDDFTSDVKTVCGIAHEVVEKPVAVEIPMIEKPKTVEMMPVEPMTTKEPLKEAEVKTKIITNKPELIPETLQGGAFR